ncbi:Beta-galactosidase C-terminal domain [Paenibacillus cremeus]
MGNQELIHDIVSNVAEECRLDKLNLPDNIYVSHRSCEGTRYTFFLNYAREAHEILLPVEGTDAITGEFISGTIKLNGLDVLVVKRSV